MIDLLKAIGVYQIRNVVTGGVYVGSTTVSFASRWGIHRYRISRGMGNVNLRAAWESDGEGALEFSVLEVVADRSQVIAREQHWIDLLKPSYNIVAKAGVTLGFRHSAEDKLRMSERQRGRRLTEEHKRKIGAAQLGVKKKPASESKKEKLRVARKKQGRSLPVGYKHSAETREKLRAAHIGRKHSDLHRANRSIAVKIWWAARKAGGASCSI